MAEQDDRRLGLALSGGGFRATLFHLGVVRYLKDAGMLQDVTAITSVSGGSVLGAHLVMNWERYNGSDEDFDAVAGELLAFARLDVRNRIIRRYPFALALAFLRRLLRLKPSRTLTRTGLLEQHYRKHLYGDACLYELPERPELHILSTNLSEGGLFSFSRDGMYSEERLKAGTGEIRRIPVGLATVPMAVTASSAFPGFFPPLEVTAQDVGDSEAELPRLFFTDGGVYDNLGARMFRYLEHGAVEKPASESKRKFSAVLVSDAGRRIQVSRPDQSSTFLQTALRASDILMDRVWQVEKEHFEGSKDFIFAPITRIVSREEDPTAPIPELQAQLSRVRTDFDGFNSLEISALTRHGYCVARQAAREHPSLASHGLEDIPWDASARPDRASKEPEAGSLRRDKPGASRATLEARRLQRSSQRRFRAVLSPRDWVSFLYVPLFLLLFVVLPYFAYDVWDQSRFSQTLSQAVAATQPQADRLVELLRRGTAQPWEGMPVATGELEALFAERGLDIISDTRIIDLRAMEVPGARTSGEQSSAYLYRVVAVRKTAHVDGSTALRLPTLRDVPTPRVRSFNPALRPVLERSGRNPSEPASWQLKLDFRAVPVGHTTQVIVEALWPARSAELTERLREWWSFQIDAEPEVATAWVLLPEPWQGGTLRLVRHPNDTPDAQELVEATHEASVFDGLLRNWTVVHPREGYTYAFQRVD